MAITVEYALEQAVLCEEQGKEVWAELWLELASEAEKPEGSNHGFLHDQDGDEKSYL